MNFFQKIPIFFFSLLYPLKIHGKENIPQGSALLLCNHFRAIDCAFVAEVYGKDISFLAKKELFKNKLFSKIITSYGGIPIDRENPDMKSLLKAIKVLKDGHKLAIFPEGTRNKTGTTQLQPIKGGTVVFSVKAKAPIVPMILSRKAKIFRKTHIIVGKPFELSEFYGEKLTEENIKKLEKVVFDKMLEQQLILMEKLSSKKKECKC